MKFNEAVEKFLIEGPIDKATKRLVKNTGLKEVEVDNLLSDVYDILSMEGFTMKDIDMIENLAEILLSSKDDPREVGQKIQDSKYSKEYGKLKKQVIDDLMNLV
jgi:hypothetical protein